mgnify:CR=1 FL=1
MPAAGAETAETATAETATVDAGDAAVEDYGGILPLDAIQAGRVKRLPNPGTPYLAGGAPPALSVIHARPTQDRAPDLSFNR